MFFIYMFFTCCTFLDDSVCIVSSKGSEKEEFRRDSDAKDCDSKSNISGICLDSVAINIFPKVTNATSLVISIKHLACPLHGHPGIPRDLLIWSHFNKCHNFPSPHPLLLPQPSLSIPTIQ